MISPKTRDRHVVSIHGDKPSVLDNSEYYNKIMVLATELSEERGEPFSLYTKAQQPGDHLADVVSPTRQYADELAERLRNTDLYQRVEVSSQKVPKMT